MQSVALVSTDPATIGHDDPDIDPLCAALEAIGLQAQVPSWRANSVDWSSFDVAVMRSPWDYADRLPQFLSWLERTSSLTRVMNPPQIIRWNFDKRYLLELAVRGVSIVESRFFESTVEVAVALDTFTSDQIVVKPSVSAGSQNTGLFDRADRRLVELAQHILEQGKTVMIQPAVASVAKLGERALVYFAGRECHDGDECPVPRSLCR